MNLKPHLRKLCVKTCFHGSKELTCQTQSNEYTLMIAEDPTGAGHKLSGLARKERERGRKSSTSLTKLKSCLLTMDNTYELNIIDVENS